MRIFFTLMFNLIVDKIADVCKAKKFIPGPGSYNVHQINTMLSTDKYSSRYIQASGKGRVPFNIPCPNTPAPSQYNIIYANGQPKLFRTMPNSTFKSSTNRQSFLKCHRYIFQFRKYIYI